MIKCLIVDDEPLARDILSRYIAEIGSMQLIMKCANVIEALKVLNKQTVDLAFLDIKMPLINGIDFIKSLQHPPAVIFTTAFSEYAADSYEIDAVDYLLKPVTFARFKKSIDKFLKQSTYHKPVEKNYLYIKTDGRLVKIFRSDILFAESMKDYMKIVTTSGKYITHLTMKALVGLLPADEFIRVHRSFVVHIDHIKSVAKNEIEIREFKIPLGDLYRSNLDSIKGRIG